MSNHSPSEGPNGNPNFQPEPLVNQNCSSPRKSIYDSMQWLFAERGLDKPLEPPKKDNNTKSAQVEIPYFIGCLDTKVSVDWITAFVDFFAWYYMHDAQLNEWPLLNSS